ncbi:MAG: hypothetical protein ABIL09_07925 [Gemmatimonadota bacterium]
MAKCVDPDTCRVARESCQARLDDKIAAVVKDLNESISEQHKNQLSIEAARHDRMERFQRGIEGTLALVTKNAIEAKIVSAAAAADVKTLNGRAWGLVAAVLVAIILGAGAAVCANSAYRRAAEAAENGRH